ncbi:MSHA biogenesis protein MshP [Vibrio paucivorans]
MFPRRKRQVGNLYIVSVFVLVVMGFLGANLARIEWSNSDSLTRDALGTQAWFAAHSVNELVLTDMYPLNASAAVSTVCASIQGGTYTNAGELVATYPNCGTVTVECHDVDNNSTDSELDGYYRIESAVVCGTGINQVQRTQEVWVKE